MKPRVLLLVADTLGPIPHDAWASISEIDRARALRYVEAAERKRFVLGRHLLRSAYSSLTGGASLPPVLAFDGKPMLAGSGPVDFSIAYAEDIVAVAVGTRGKVGVDVERLGALDLPGLADSFSEEELASFRRLPPEEAAREWLASWTAKEASAKFLGCPADLDHRRLPASAGERCRVRNWSLRMAFENFQLCLAHDRDAEVLMRKESTLGTDSVQVTPVG